MRRTKTRARPIDIYKRMTIVRSEAQLPEDSETIESAVVVSTNVSCLFSAPELIRGLRRRKSGRLTCPSQM